MNFDYYFRLLEHNCELNRQLARDELIHYFRQNQDLYLKLVFKGENRTEKEAEIFINLCRIKSIFYL